jgi:hypothetical protein
MVEALLSHHLQADEAVSVVLGIWVEMLGAEAGV